MRLKSIALLVVAMLLVVGSVAAIAAAGAEDRSSDEGWRMDARYWWEVWWEGVPLTPYQREQIGEITALILDRYFGIEDSFVMSPDEFAKVTKPLGYEKEWEALRLLGYYAQKKGFEVPAGVFVVPGFETPPAIPFLACPPFVTSPEGYNVIRPYWWEILCPEEWLKDYIEKIAEKFPGVKLREVNRNLRALRDPKLREMTPSEVKERLDELFPGLGLGTMMSSVEFFAFLDSLPQPLFKPLCLLEGGLDTYGTIAIVGRVPSLYGDELKEFDEKIGRVIDALPTHVLDLIPPEKAERGAAVWVRRGAVKIGISGDICSPNVPVLAEKIHEKISAKAESLYGIEDVAVVFTPIIIERLTLSASR